MLYIVGWRIFYCERRVVKPKVHRMCLAVWMFKEYDCRIIFMKKIFLFMKKNISLRENKYLCSRKDLDFGKLLRGKEMVFFFL